MSDDPQTEQLQASDEDDHADRGSPSGNGIPPDQTAHDDEDQKQEGDAGHQHPEPGCDVQRRVGKVDNAVDGIFEQLPEAPLGRSGDALHILVREPIGPEADPAENALGKAIVFGHGEDGVLHGPGHEPEVSCAVNDIRVRDLIDQPVKPAGEPAADRRLAGSVRASRGDTVILPALEDLHHFGQQRRRILKICVHYGHVVAARVGKTGVHGGLLAEIP